MTDLKTFDTSLAWDVQEKPLYNQEGQQIEGYKRLVHSETNNTLNICKNSYTPVLNEQLTELAQTLADNHGFDLKGYASFKEGRKVIAYLENKNTKQLAGFPSSDYLILGNSHDGSSSFFVGASNYLYRCENMFTSTKQQWKLPHRKGVGAQLDNIADAYDLYYNEKTGMYEQLEDFAAMSVTPKEIAGCVDYLLDAESSGDMSTRMQNIRAQIGESIQTECEELGNNAFGLFNGVTHYTTHSLNGKNVFGNPFGHANKLNRRAFEYCTELLKYRPKMISVNAF